MAQTIEVGDVVAIRGDKRRVYDRVNGGFKCAYHDEQLVDGKYIKHMGTGLIWTGTIDKVEGDMALCAGGWRGIEMYEVMAKKGVVYASQIQAGK